MNKEKTPKHHRICMKCRVQSTGDTIKECEETFGRCGLDGGVPNDACKTRILQDGQKIFEIISVVELAKLRKNKESSITVEFTTASTSNDNSTKSVDTKKSPKDSKKTNSKKSKN